MPEPQEGGRSVGSPSGSAMVRQKHQAAMNLSDRVSLYRS